MEPDVRLLCRTCGTVFEVERVLKMHAGRPRFCVYCGGSDLQAVKAAAEGIKHLEKAYGPLVQLLWPDWAKDPEGHETLLSYIQHKLTEG